MLMRRTAPARRGTRSRAGCRRGVCCYCLCARRARRHGRGDDPRSCASRRCRARLEGGTAPTSCSINAGHPRARAGLNRRSLLPSITEGQGSEAAQQGALSDPLARRRGPSLAALEPGAGAGAALDAPALDLSMGCAFSGELRAALEADPPAAAATRAEAAAPATPAEAVAAAAGATGADGAGASAGVVDSVEAGVGSGGADAAIGRPPAATPTMQAPALPAARGCAPQPPKRGPAKRPDVVNPFAAAAAAGDAARAAAAAAAGAGRASGLARFRAPVRPAPTGKLESFDRRIGRAANALQEVQLTSEAPRSDYGGAGARAAAYLPSWLAAPLGGRGGRRDSADYASSTSASTPAPPAGLGGPASPPARAASTPLAPARPPLHRPRAAPPSARARSGSAPAPGAPGSAALEAAAAAAAAAVAAAAACAAPAAPALLVLGGGGAAQAADYWVRARERACKLLALPRCLGAPGVPRAGVAPRCFYG